MAKLTEPYLIGATLVLPSEAAFSEAVLGRRTSELFADYVTTAYVVDILMSMK